MLKIIKQLYRFSNVRDKIKRQRQTRLGKGVSESILPTKSIEEIQKIRNVGIIAHIDAGKTTTTERMLYYAGALPSPGDIDQGTTTMDYMKQQRQRGITIRSAAISFNWNKYQVNLIDTPGHVDFSGEVARSLKVLDGAITILDGVKGVQAQTIKVWEQAKRRNIPRICYVNKLDRIGGSVLQTAQSIKKRLKVQPLLMQFPIGQSDLFKGVIDLLEMKQIFFEGNFGNKEVKKNIGKDYPKYQELLKYREYIVEQVGNFDDQIGQLYLSEQKVPADKIRRALRKILTTQNQHNICPIFIGSSYKNKGVQPLMDAIIDLLPSPDQRDPVKDIQNSQDIRRPTKEDPLSAYVFKILYDLEMGPLAYTRIYSGNMKKNTNLMNSSSNCPQKISHLYRVRANQYVPVGQVSAGDIIAISGLKDTKAGQTLTQFGSKKFVLDNLQLPSAIFTVPFELQSSKYSNAFQEAIQKAIIQDNSLIYEHDIQTGQHLLSGLGQLHLEILRDKFIADNIPVKMGSLKINYKETINSAKRDTYKIRRQLKPGMFEQFQIEIEVAPLRTDDEMIEKVNRISFEFEKVKQFDENWRQFLRRKQMLAHGKKGGPKNLEDQTQQNFVKASKKSIRNPTPVEPMESYSYDQDDQVENGDDDEENEGQTQTLRSQDNEALYHISTLPFETLYELYQTFNVNLLYGKRNFPLTGVQIKVHNGIYTKSTFSKSVANRCASELMRNLLNSSSILLQPVMQFTLQGEEQMIDIAVKDILSKRGTIDVQQIQHLTGNIPASEVRGWIKELRAMGLEVQMKFKCYEEVIGVDPDKLIERS